MHEKMWGRTANDLELFILQCRGGWMVQGSDVLDDHPRA